MAKSVMTHLFSKIPGGRVNRSSFRQPSGHKTTLDSGNLVPVMCKEVLPGDNVSIRCSFLARLSTLLYPIMDNVFFDWFWFFVPNRILWEHWVNLCGEKATHDDITDYVVPVITADPITFAVHSLGDYFGLPTGRNLPENISALPFLAYNRIWNDWFRVPYLQDPVYQDIGDGPHNLSSFTLLKRNKRHDYITSALPEPQYGDAVTLSFGSTAPVIGDGGSLGLTDGSAVRSISRTYNAIAAQSYLTQAGTTTDYAIGATITPNNDTDSIALGVATTAARSGLIADLSSAFATTINDIREAIVTQQILEADMRGGTRYTEILQQIWGVHPEDSRLQRPEYLGGGSQPINVTAVAQTAASPATPTNTNVKAGLAAYGVQGASGKVFKSFSEHGILMCLVNVRADINYQQFIDRMWTRSTRYDFHRPEFDHLGEQAILNKEVQYEEAGTPDGIFGYQERAAEYRYSRNYVSGKMRSDASGTLDAWHLALDFNTTVPTLSETFLQDSPPLARVQAVADEPQILLDCYFDAQWTRCMPIYSVPGLDRL